METISITSHLPNWSRFLEKYNPNTEFISAFFSRIFLIKDIDIRDSVLKRINIELWILLLHEVEINQKKYELILESINNK